MINVLTWMPLIWLAMAIIFGIAESMTFNFVAVWFAIGAISAIIPASFHLPIMVQLAVFILVSIITLIFTRPFVHKFIKPHMVRTNADSLVGRIGIVIKEINNTEGKGRVSIAGLDWAAISEDDIPISTGEKVLIKRIEGVKLIVEKLL